MADECDFLTYRELADMSEHDTTDQFRTAAEFLLSAVEDWPVYGQQQPTEFVTALKEEVKDKLNFHNLKQYYTRLTLEGDGWRIESISALLELFDFDRKNHFDNTISLEEIINRMTKHYRRLH